MQDALQRLSGWMRGSLPPCVAWLPAIPGCIANTISVVIDNGGDRQDILVSLSALLEEDVKTLEQLWELVDGLNAILDRLYMMMEFSRQREVLFQFPPRPKKSLPQARHALEGASEGPLLRSTSTCWICTSIIQPSSPHSALRLSTCVLIPNSARESWLSGSSETDPPV